MGDVFVYSDVDIQFFKPVNALLIDAIEGYDIVCQKDHPDDGQLCTGFFVIKATKRTLKLWKLVHQAIKKEGQDQLAFNRFIRRLKYWPWNLWYLCPSIKDNYLPK